MSLSQRNLRGVLVDLNILDLSGSTTEALSIAKFKIYRRAYAQPVHNSVIRDGICYNLSF